MTQVKQPCISEFVFRLIRPGFSFQKLKISVFELTTYSFSVGSLNHYTNAANYEWKTWKIVQ